MATFKVGQRVKVVSVEDAFPSQWHSRYLGCEGVIDRVGPVECGDFNTVQREYGVTLDKFGPHFGFDAIHLAPLTDPLAEQFVERMKKLAHEPAPRMTEKV